jgi:glycerol dehydrogenase
MFHPWGDNYMKFGMAMPRKYIQGDGVMSELGTYVSLLGNKPLLVWGPRSRAASFEAAEASLREQDLEWAEWMFEGESTVEQAKRMQIHARENGSDVIVGLGGGKVIDTAKGVAGWMRLPVLVAPTVAATDAPITSTSGWYNEDGIMEEIYVAPFNPDILLVDTGIIARAPVRMFIAGMGDGITTWLEASASYASRTTETNRTGGISTMATRAIAKLCRDTLLQDGIEAMHLVEKKLVTPVVERVVEALVLHSGIGGESGGIAAAHSIANNLPYFKLNRAYYHGENVAFGVAVQLALDDSNSLDETRRLVDWMLSARLPVTLAGVGLGGLEAGEIYSFAQYCIESPVSFFNSMSAPVTAVSLANAILAADDYGRRRELALV